MKIKKNTFSTLVLELLFPSIANCRKLKIQKNSKIDFPYCSAFGRDYYASVLPNHTVQYVKPATVEVDCGPYILLQPVPAEVEVRHRIYNPTIKGQLSIV
jgi:hypothetical protein